MTDHITKLLDDVQRLDQLEKDVADALQNDNYALAGSCVRKHENVSIDLAPTMGKALRAVMEMHHKTGHQRAYGFPRADKWEHYCTADNQSWPCPTVQAITDALEESGVV